MKSDDLELLSINKLLGENFYIPAYQRGYRWKEQQVKALLNDIWEFRESPPKHEEGKEKPFYCLQPIVVKKKEEENLWEVIDGQQRLTTIFIILNYFNLTEYQSRPKRTFSIEYQTRSNCVKFFKKIEAKELAEKNIDFFHINFAHETIDKWFNDRETDNDSIRHDFRSSLINDVKFIWYDVKESSSTNGGSSSIDIFTRLNIGKIPLTNAELVKALFLQKGNFHEDKVSLKQLQIASEWDAIEKVLQDNAFWYFIYNPDNPLKYDTRIEYIFDLMKKKTKDDETYFTFYKFHDAFVKSKQEKDKPDIDALWKEIKKYFLSFEEWYNNRKLYHLIGFLVDCDYDINTLKDKAGEGTKTVFKNYIKDEIRKQVECQVDELNYGDKRIKKVLLLFNIQTILATENADMRFPFYRYKDENWDIEHVRSQTDKQITGTARKGWTVDVLEYFTGEKGYSDKKVNGSQKTEKEVQKEATKTLEKDEKSFSQRLMAILDDEKIEDEKFDKLYSQLISHFDESAEPENIDSISNLALLDAATNRSYKNAMFPIKRKTIIENDMNGVFVPICTKNVFLKSYSKKMGDVMYWKDSDANDYLAAIKETLKEYLPIREENNEK